LTTEIAVRSTELTEPQSAAGALALRGTQTQWTDEQRAALTQLGLAEATPADLQVFMHQSQRTGLDPFSRQIYMIARWDSQAQRNKYTIQTGIDGFRIIAERRPEYRGQIGPEWCGDDGVWRDVWIPKEPPVAARVGVIREDWPNPVYAVAKFSEFAQYKSSGGLTAMWSSKAAHMIAKCAEALALRKAFPQDLSGLITDDEAARDDVGRAEPPARRAEVVQGVTVDELTGAQPAPPQGTVSEAQQVMRQIVEAGRERGWTAVELTADFKTRAGGTDPANAPENELRAYLAWLIKQSHRSQATTKPSKRMLDKLHAQLSELQVAEKDRHETLSMLVGRQITSANDLSKDETQTLVNQLENVLADENPAAAMDGLLAAAVENTTPVSGA
jgi:phage recombination protein Bet